jgi:spore germination protein YaaH
MRLETTTFLNWVTLLLAAIAGFMMTPASAEARSPEVAGWIPYWAAEEGIESAIDNIRELDTIYPFVFEVAPDGVLINKVDFEDEEWEELFEEADDHDVEIIPTIAWFDGEEIDFVLRNKTLRERHIDLIEDMVDEYDFAGVDIDYEGKKSDTIDYFSLFLEDLQDALNRRQTLVCTLEARTPPDSLYRDVPETIEYANDYEEIAEHCDRIQLMAYDQQRADIMLNDERRGVPYMPVADKDWVEKVIEFALEDFDEDTVMLGAPTYGRAWDVTVASEWYRDYTRVATLNQPRILELADKYDAPIGRTEGGEAVISYFPEDSIWQIFNVLPVPEGTPRGFEAAAKALLVATVADIELPVRIVVWSDADAVEDKLSLVEEYDLRGLSLFKIDGEEDPDIWDLF